MSGTLRFDQVTKRFGDFLAVDRLSLEIPAGETFSLLGPSGCGKTTLLRMAAGFERPDEGRILLDGIDITDLPPERRPLNTVFQSYALFPHLSVRDNIAFGLKLARRSRQDVETETKRMLELTDLVAHGEKKPALLSGGQKQRVAIARALINKPSVLLLDEPLAALDLKLRQRLLMELDTIHDEVGITFLYVTHDQNEAMSISDHIAVMNEGKIEQQGTPREIYESPRTAFVASFIGDTNFFQGDWIEQSQALRIKGLGDIPLSSTQSIGRSTPLSISLRPEKITLSRTRSADRIHTFAGTIDDVIYFGSRTRYWILCGDHRICVELPHLHILEGESAPSWGDEVFLYWNPDDVTILP